MAKNRIMVLSDIHIGTDATSNWYQSQVHQNLLIASLQWAQNDANNVGELVLLGDLVDLWTYPPDPPLPTFEDITHTLPTSKAIFGPGGELAKTVNVLGKDKVVYVNGNHDMTVTADQIHAAISSDVKVMPQEEPVYLAVLGPRPIYMTHGHLYSLLCATDYVNPPTTWNRLPLGYFITRLSALLSNIECLVLGTHSATTSPRSLPTFSRCGENTNPSICPTWSSTAYSLIRMTMLRSPPLSCRGTKGRRSRPQPTRSKTHIQTC